MRNLRSSVVRYSSKDKKKLKSLWINGRVRCDYDVEVVLDNGEVSKLLNEAEHFVDKIDGLVRIQIAKMI